jgi:hypothetical protein
MRWRGLLLGIAAVAGCATAVDSTRGHIEKMQGRSVDDVIRELGAPAGQYALPQSGHVVYVYDAQRLHKGSAVGTILGGAGSGMTGQPNTVQPRKVSCRFELEFGDDGRLLRTTERGEGC